MTTEKGIENLRVAISANNTFGDLQAKDLVLQSEESTKSTTTTGIKRLGIPSINVIFSFSFLPLSLFCSSVSRLAVFNQSINQLYFSLLHLFAISFCCVLSLNVSRKVLHFVETSTIQLKSRDIFKERNA